MSYQFFIFYLQNTTNGFVRQLMETKNASAAAGAFFAL